MGQTWDETRQNLTGGLFEVDPIVKTILGATYVRWKDRAVAASRLRHGPMMPMASP